MKLVLVGMYSRLSDVVKSFHWWSSSCGGGMGVVILSAPKCNISVEVAT